MDLPLRSMEHLLDWCFRRFGNHRSRCSFANGHSAIPGADGAAAAVPDLCIKPPKKSLQGQPAPQLKDSYVCHVETLSHVVRPNNADNAESLARSKSSAPLLLRADERTCEKAQASHPSLKFSLIGA